MQLPSQLQWYMSPYGSELRAGKLQAAGILGDTCRVDF